MVKHSLEPVKSKSTKFRVAIKSTEDWKIRAVAAYKKKINEKQKLKEQSDAKTKGSSETSPAPPKTVIADEQIRRELEILQNNSNVVRNKMLALSSIRHSVLWLLKKATLVERQIVS